MIPDHYYTIEKPAVAEYKAKGSKFIAYTFPVENIKDFKEKLAAIKKEHPKATHHCFAYRLGLDGSNFRISDDGEPSGTAGKPLLGQIDSKQVTNILIIVVRYFGGTMLGVSGLIKAYKTTAALVLQLTHVVQKDVRINYRLQFNYTIMNDVMKIIKQYGCTILQQETKLFCSLQIGIPKKIYEEALSKLKELNVVEIKTS